VPVPSSPIPSATAVQYTSKCDRTARDAEFQGHLWRRADRHFICRVELVARLLECLSEFERWLGSPLLQMDFGVRSSKMKSGAV
jgi:hypothetical protein